MYDLRLENEKGNIVNINDEVNYAILSVSGLNPPKADIFTAKSPNRKGLKYNGSTLNGRSIALTIKIMGDIERNRNALYEYIETELYVKIRYKNGVKNVYCEGHIEECEIELFTDNEIIELLILCEDPYWKDLSEIAVDISDLTKNFKFPFAIDNAGIPFSTKKENNVTSIFNAGSETGLKMKLMFSGRVTNPVIYDATTSTKIFRINSTFGGGEYIIIDTTSSPKTVTLYHTEGTYYNYLPYVDNDITWFTLKKGINNFAFSAKSGVNNMKLTVEFRNQFLGV